MDFSVLNNLSQAVIFIGLDKKIIFMNSSAKKLIKKKEGESCVGLFSICENCPLEDIKKDKNKRENFDIKLNCCDLTVCHTITPVIENNKVIGILEEFRDYTKVSNYLKQIKKEKEFSRKILDSIVDSILVVDEIGNIIDYNHNAKQILCKELSDIKGMNIEFLLSKKIYELPEEREDIYINTPALGNIKVSLLSTPLKEDKGRLISFYVIPECMLNQEAKGRLVSKNPKMIYILETVKTIVDTNASVLLEGESGVGKNVIARYIHSLSSRRDKPFIKINCAAIPENLLESELFGYVKGAFTGAVRDKPGKVELADGGTLFLDEIGDMPLYLQSKLLHLIQEKEFERLGDTKTRKVNIRIVAATNKDLKEAIKKGDFREDLYYRLKVISLTIPPLRERKEDIPFLVNFFIDKYSQMYNKSIKGISPEAIKALLDYHYPGNIRELENIIERAVILAKKRVIDINDLPEEIFIKEQSNQQKSEIEKIKDVLKQTNGNKSLAAKILGINRVTLWRKIKEFGIEEQA
ncbi:sigma 54-interacting transcriptional regulator [Venenivibrio stagnispumantis]|uniref:Transcriptional regulator containing PAS, AAA-type ATPase, and DNA-binding Fis domains n=1 Tax=Venenivibrio stagnispumantis TaxID=407998 RepID=A0AA46ADG1_9AQUI|nr:sigma 54-interacting transcriptional regulator [Venenivibrio stagnispumantis]MCW4572949.1 sigma 54-interacting transcriptional regulator [Venenivibrio stagnispumantis]SMP04894.1 Transcriptional regulator containing PAS, AAA-type ATPase, and DNA-binding Fis domains [Venenivibrio stagnispumantis]